MPHTTVARIYRRYLLANARHDAEWSYRWFSLLEAATKRPIPVRVRHVAGGR